MPTENKKGYKVPLPGGSYDVLELRKNLEPAAKEADDAKRQSLIEKAIEKSGEVHNRTGTSLVDHEIAEVEHPTLGIMEKTPVYVPRAEGKPAAHGADTAAPAANKE